MDPTLEIRKLPVEKNNRLINLLEEAEGWRRLMAVIPKIVDPDVSKYQVTEANPNKYLSDHFRKIVEFSNKQNTTCSDSLLYSWARSGRVRVTLAHLLHLLKKAKLYRAADYVACDLLEYTNYESNNNNNDNNESENVNSTNNTELEMVLDDLTVSESQLNVNTNAATTENNINKKDAEKNPQKTVDVAANLPEPVKIVSDMMKFSSQSVKDDGGTSPDVVPEFSALLNTQNTPPQVPPFLDTSSNSNTSSADSVVSSGDAALDAEPSLPNMSIFNVDATDSSSADEGAVLPELSDLMSAPKTPGICLSDLLMQNTTSSNAENDAVSQPQTLEFFTHSEVVAATNNFNATPFTGDENSDGRLLNAGRYSDVFLALNLFAKNGSGRCDKVAVKRTKFVQDQHINELLIGQFGNQVEIMRACRHENLTSLQGYLMDTLNKQYCLMFEFVPGGTLQDRLIVGEEGRVSRLNGTHPKLTWQERVRIGRGVSEAINYLHTNFVTPIVHRDVKSTNILIDAQNEAKLCDFDLIRRLSSSSSIDYVTSTIQGTAAYMAPEVNRGEITKEQDIYSFGIVLLELLTSLPVLDCNRENVFLMRHVEELSKTSVAGVLDTSTGGWTRDDVNYGEELYRISKSCTEYEAKQRPSMIEVLQKFRDFVRCLE